MAATIDDEALGAVPVEAGARRRLLWRYFWRYRWGFGLGALFLLLTNLMQYEIPALLGEAVELMRRSLEAGTAGARLEAVRGELLEAAALIIALAIGSSVVRIMSRITIFNAGRDIEFDVRDALYDKLTSLSPAFFDLVRTGDVTSRVTNDVSYVRLLYAISFLHLVNTGVAYVIALQKMVQLNLELTLWCLAPYTVLLLTLRVVVRKLFVQTKVVQAQMSTLSTRVQENLAGVQVVKAYNLQERESGRFEVENGRYLKASVELALWRGALNALMLMVAGTGTLIVLAVGSQMVVAEEMSLGDFVAFNGYVVSLAFPTAAMGWVFAVWNRGLAAFDRIMAVLFFEPAITDPPQEDRRELPALVDEAGQRLPAGHIELQGVSFRYPRPDESVSLATGGEEAGWVLRGVDLEIAPGQTVAIVGRTGSGKTTLAKLLARLYDPSQGSVRLDGQDLRSLQVRRLRAEVGVVPQEPFLFSMTIGQNLRFGLDALEYDPSIGRSLPTTPLTGAGEATADQDERIAQAVEVAGLGPDMVAFPQGLDTLVGERGITLSGGQKQRVTIARALLIDPRVLILDDALSSVDTRTEATILDALSRLMRGRTSVIITHRFSILHRVDQVIVLERGRVAEQGSHRELLARGGLYAEMYEQQRARESLEAEQEEEAEQEQQRDGGGDNGGQGR